MWRITARNIYPTTENISKHFRWVFDMQVWSKFNVEILQRFQPRVSTDSDQPITLRRIVFICRTEPQDSTQKLRSDFTYLWCPSEQHHVFLKWIDGPLVIATTNYFNSYKALNFIVYTTYVTNRPKQLYLKIIDD